MLVKSADEAGNNAQRHARQDAGDDPDRRRRPEGQTAARRAGLDIARELYLGIVVDREVGLPVLMVSSEGGMNIEEVAEKNPEKIFREHFDPAHGLCCLSGAQAGHRVGLKRHSVEVGREVPAEDREVLRRSRLQHGEINPLVRHRRRRDAGARCEDHLRRQRPVPSQGLRAAARPRRRRSARKSAPGRPGLSYVKLDGNIGCLVNGAGLAMSTMDIIKLHGGEPANFLDVGGGANIEQVTEAFRILLADQNVKAVLVNIFGGIMKCDTIVTALLDGLRHVGINVPLVVRLEGTNVEVARKMLAKSGKKIISATDLTDAAKESRRDARGVTRFGEQGASAPCGPRGRASDWRANHDGSVADLIGSLWSSHGCRLGGLDAPGMIPSSEEDPHGTQEDARAGRYETALTSTSVSPERAEVLNERSGSSA